MSSPLKPLEVMTSDAVLSGNTRRDRGAVHRIVAMGLGALCWGLVGSAIAQTPESLAAPAEAADSYLRPQTPCPRDLEILTAGLLRDLPSYANRVAYRSLGTDEDLAGFGTMLLAGRAEFEPLAIEPLQLMPSSDRPADSIRQVFFTTLERHYLEDDFTHLQQYHWLFLAEASDGWRLTLMFSRLAPDEATLRPPTPPRESSQGIVGQAVRLWLRDCRAGAVYPVEPQAASETVDGMGR